MKGEITADLTVIPVSNIIAIGAVVVVVLIVAAVLMKKLGISIGSIKPTVYEYDQYCQTEMFHVQEAITDIDTETRHSMRKYTSFGTYAVSKISELGEACSATRIAMTLTMKQPLMDFIAANHFTKELKGERFDSYRRKVVGAIRDTYTDILYDIKNSKCNTKLPDWEDARSDYENLIDSWMYMILQETRNACRKKIDVYTNARRIVEKNKRWLEVIDSCIAKNQDYIKDFEEKITKMKTSFKMENSNVIEI